jgi:hypothetical protein
LGYFGFIKEIEGKLELEETYAEASTCADIASVQYFNENSLKGKFHGCSDTK